MNPSREFTFLLTDLDYCLSKEGLPLIRLYGKRPNNKNKLVLVYVHDFLPYLYIKWTKDLEYVIQNDPLVKWWHKGRKNVTLRRYFWGGEEVKLVKLYGSDPKRLAEVNQALADLGLETFEADISFLKRFLIDTNLKCLNVITTRNATVIKKDGEKVFLKASYRDLFPISKENVHSPDHFYQLKIMALSLSITREKDEPIKSLLKSKDRPIIALSVVWGTSSKPNNGKLFLNRGCTSESEKKVILEFLAKLHQIQPDVLLTFKGDSFALPYLLERMRRLGIRSQALSLFQQEPVHYINRLISYRIRGRISLDLSLRTWHIHPASGKKTLDDIAKTVLGRERKPLRSSLKALWYSGVIKKNKNDLRSFLRVISLDCKLIYDLFWALGLNSWLVVLRTTGFPPAEASSCTERVNGEFELMRYLRRKGILIPKHPDTEQIQKNKLERELRPHEGGAVFPPLGLIHTAVIITDFRSMYPSVMAAHNIGAETINQWRKAKDYGKIATRFHQQSPSCLSLLEKTMLQKRLAKKKLIKLAKDQLARTTGPKERDELKETLKILESEQKSLKIVANSMYGAHYYIRSRFFTQTLAGAIANSSRNYLLQLVKILEEMSQELVPCKLIYGDTDSAFIKILDPELVLTVYSEKDPQKRTQALKELMALVRGILEKINETLPQPMKLQLEDIAYRVIFKPGRKKAYSYVSLLTDKCKIAGFEAVRSDWSPLAQAAQKKVLDILLRGKNSLPAQTIEQRVKANEDVCDQKEFLIAKRFLLELGKRVLQMPHERLLSKVTIRSSIRQAPSNYQVKPAAVHAFLAFAKEEGLNPETDWLTFDKFPWIITAGSGAIYRRARHPKYVKTIDREHYIKEMLRACENFGVTVSLEEVKSALTLPLKELLTEGSEVDWAKKTILPYSTDDFTFLQHSHKRKTKKKKKKKPLPGQQLLIPYTNEGKKDNT